MKNCIRQHYLLVTAHALKEQDSLLTKIWRWVQVTKNDILMNPQSRTARIIALIVSAFFLICISLVLYRALKLSIQKWRRQGQKV
jgi:hypothetical protein